jgi:antitoxin ParD1/3/4
VVRGIENLRCAAIERLAQIALRDPRGNPDAPDESDSRLRTQPQAPAAAMSAGKFQRDILQNPTMARHGNWTLFFRRGAMIRHSLPRYGIRTRAAFAVCAPTTARDSASGKRGLANFAITDIVSDIQEISGMPTRNISLTAEQDAFVESVVKAGEYQNASEAVRDALRVLRQRRQEDALKLKALRAQIKAGVDALDRGDFVEVDDGELDGFLEGLTTRLGKHAR